MGVGEKQVDPRDYVGEAKLLLSTCMCVENRIVFSF